MTSLNSCLQYLLLILQLSFVLGRFMNFTKTQHSFNEKYLKNFTTWLENGALNVDADTERVFEYGFRGNLVVQIKIGNSKNYQRMFAYDYDVCKVLSEISRDSIVNYWYRMVLKHSNIMENCPMPKAHYYIHNMRLDGNSLPVFLRPSEYQIISTHYFGKRKTKSYEMALRLVAGIRIY
uniref:Uncharacterized protein n=1 Tax=Musca domestica TaxID=7370 RepID=A0A1I8M8N9_MUSDO